jgi:hypothetical protein
MNKPEAKDNLIPVRDYALLRPSRRGGHVTVQYIYKLISEAKKGERTLDFKYIEEGDKKTIWIVQ